MRPAFADPTFPAQPLDPDSPEVRELLESLDDAMFAAIAGEAAPLREARQLWQQAVDELPPELVEESREQYLRYATEVTRRFEAAEIREPKQALAAIEILQLLTRL
jgi:hypothetical protein